jgi:RNA polymerase sigma-70 factor (family 1)
MKSNHEAALIKKFNLGDRDAFNEIYECYRTRLYHFVRKLIGDEAEAEDIVMVTFEKLFERSANFPRQANIKAFLFITARHAALDFLGSNKRRKDSQKELINRTDISEEKILNNIVEAELLEEIRNEVKKLPEKQRLIFMMFYDEGLSHKEIAERLKINEIVVRVTKSRVLVALRKFVHSKQLLPVLLATYLFFV